jgi:hypothetical protein
VAAGQAGAGSLEMVLIVQKVSKAPTAERAVEALGSTVICTDKNRHAHAVLHVGQAFIAGRMTSHVMIIFVLSAKERRVSPVLVFMLKMIAGRRISDLNRCHETSLRMVEDVAMHHPLPGAIVKANEQL